MKYHLRTFLVVALILSLGFPLSSQAVLAPGAGALPSLPTVPTSVPALEAKETGIKILGFNIGISWDLIAINIVKRTLEEVVDSTIVWINNGFDGNPAFVTDPEQYFLNIADGIAGEFIAGTDLGFVCSPFQAEIRIALQKSYLRRGSGTAPFQCTLSQVGNNFENFYDNFGVGGGWDTWFAMTQDPANNPYGAYIGAKIELDSRIEEALNIEETQLSWGSGFLSMKGPDGNIVTPGVAIEGQLQKVLGTGVTQLELADEMDELISALVGQLLQKTVFSAKGLISGHQTGSGTASGNTSSTPPPTTATPPSSTSAQAYVSCSPTQLTARVDESVVWVAESSLGPNAVYNWSGEGITQGNSSGTLATYTSPGVKSAQVSAVSTDANGNSQTLSAACNNSVVVTEGNTF